MNQHKKILLLFLDTDWQNPRTGGELVNAEVIQFALEHQKNVELFTGEHLPRIIRHQKVLSRICMNIICAFWCIRQRYDLIITDQYLHSKIVLAMYIARMRGAKQIAIVYHLNFPLRRNFLLRLFEKTTEKALLKIVNLIITLSESAEREVQALGIDKQKIKRITPSRDYMRENYHLPQHPKHNNGLKLLFVGTCYERKGIRYLLEAITLLTNQVSLDIVGKYEEKDPYYISLQNIIADHKLEEQVHFHGRVSDSELKQFYQSADVFVLPSLWEGFGFVLQEAMAAGLPIITTDVGSIPELITNDENGILVAAADSRAIATAIAYLDEHPEKRTALGEAGHQQILLSNTQNSFAKQLFDASDNLYAK